VREHPHSVQGLADRWTHSGWPACRTLRPASTPWPPALTPRPKPVFDVAIGILDTGADLLGAVPKAILPDDLLQELEAACAPVEAMDLEPVRGDYAPSWRSIVSSIDADVLTELEAAFSAVVTFPRHHRPGATAAHRTRIEHVRRDGGRLRDVDPDLPCRSPMSCRCSTT
jgi:hypothetical protein